MYDETEIKRIGVAVGKAVILWSVLYIVIIQSFIILKWDATNESIGISSSVSTTSSGNGGTSDGSFIEYTDDEIQEIIQQLQDSIHITKTKIQQVRSYQESVQEIMEEYNTLHTELQNVLEQQNRSSGNTPRKIPETLKLKQLLSIGADLDGEVRSAKQFDKYIQAATTEISKNLNLDNESRTKVDWSVYTTFFRTETFPSKKNIIISSNTIEHDDSGGGSCSMPVVPSTSNGLYATPQDIDNIMDRVDDVFLSFLRDEEENPNSKRKTNSTSMKVGRLPFSFSQTVTKLQHFIQNTVERTIKELETTAATTKGSSSSSNYNKKPATSIAENNNYICLSDYDIDNWIASGLDAMYRGYDIREGILGAMEEEDVPGITKMILDADLTSLTTPASYAPIPNELRQRQLYNQRPHNIRQLVDKPILYSTLSLLDPLVDLLSGQHDILDDLLEKYVWSKIPEEKSNQLDIISTSFISALLNITGTIPIPQEYWDIVISKLQG